MQLSDLILSARTLLAEPDPNGRWSNTDLTNLANLAQRQVGLRVEFPESSMFTTTLAASNPGAAEYVLPEISLPLRVYLAGQLLSRTTIGRLEGDDLEMWDHSTSVFAPQWTQQSPESYPVSNGATGYPIGSAIPWYPGNYPQYYFRAGNVGLLPAPAAAYTLQIDVVSIPGVLQNLTDYSDLPGNFQEAITWKMCALAHKADGDDEQANNADQQFEKQIMVLNTWKRRLESGGLGSSIIIFPERAKWRRGRCWW